MFKDGAAIVVVGIARVETVGALDRVKAELLVGVVTRSVVNDATIVPVVRGSDCTETVLATGWVGTPVALDVIDMT